MASEGPKGSIILKLLIVFVFIPMLAAVIFIPDKIWQEEKSIELRSKSNMNAIFEAEKFYFARNQKYVPADSLDKLIQFIQTDSSLASRQAIGKLTNSLNDTIWSVLNTPVLNALTRISKSVDEIYGDLTFNSRYFSKYEEISAEADRIAGELQAFQSSGDFPVFCTVKSYVDSLNGLKEQINDYKLQVASLLARRYADSLAHYLPRAEIPAVESYWNTQYQNISALVKKIKKTDIVQVSSVADRLKKFIDRINTAMKEMKTADLAQNGRVLQKKLSGLDKIHESFISPENFLLSKRNGLLQLSENDSLLIKLRKEDFYDPDLFDGEQTYLIGYQKGKSSLVVESPNLLDDFQKRLIAATQPLENLQLQADLEGVTEALDSTINTMNETKDKYKLSKYSSNFILNLKELIAEMRSLNDVKFYRYCQDLKTLVDTVRTERKISTLKPLIEDNLNAIDTLAARIERKDIHDLTAKMQYFGKKVKALDSLMMSMNVPRSIKRELQPFTPTFEQVYSRLDGLKANLNAADGQKMRAAVREMESALLEVLNGYSEPVYGVFYKKHVNHGYILDGKKSWEAE